MTRRRPSRSAGEAPGQLDLFGPPAEGWWCEERATTSGVSREKTDGLLCDLGVLPGGRPGLHESFLRMCEFARRGRR